MSHLTLSNWFSYSITPEEFLQLTTTFQKAAQESWGTPAKIDLTLSEKPKSRTCMDEHVGDAINESLNATYEDSILLQTNDPKEVLSKYWEEIPYIVGKLSPAYKQETNGQYAIMHFKWNGDPGKVHMSISPNDNSTLQKVALQNWQMRPSFKNPYTFG